MVRARNLGVVLSSFALLTVAAHPAAAYGSSKPPVAGKWKITTPYENYHWTGGFTITHGPVTIHHLTWTPRSNEDMCDNGPISVVGNLRMHLYSGVNPHHIHYTAWAVGRNDPQGKSGDVIAPVPVTVEQGGDQFRMMLSVAIQFPRGGGSGKTDGTVRYTRFGQDCEWNFFMKKT